MDLSSSIVFVQKDQENLPETKDETENQDNSPSTPPFSIIPPQHEDMDSLNSSTPPEFVEKPANLTASLLKYLGDEGKASGNTDPDTPMNTPVEVEFKEEKPVDLTSIQQIDQSDIPKEDSANQDVPAANQSEGFMQYIPHISVGVAAAAALVGIYALKK